MQGSGREIPNRDLQREIVFQRIQSPISREAIRSSISGNKVAAYEYTYSTEFQQNVGKISDVLQKEGGDVYTYIFAAATVARTPTELTNTLGLLRLLQEHTSDKTRYESGRPFGRFVEQAQRDFLHSRTTTPFASDGARTIQAELIAIWNNEVQKSDVYRLLSTMKNAIHNKFLYSSAFAWNREEGERVEKHLIEGYLLSVLDPNTPFDLRMALLANPSMFNFGHSPPWHEEKYSASNVSFWQYVNAGWIYPDLAGDAQGDTDVKDWEIAGLRRRVDALQREIETSPQQPSVDPATQEELRRLRSLAGRMRRAFEDAEEKLRVYKELGQHPLDALGIGYGIWKNATEEQRREIVLRAYREKSKRYLYQTPRSDPNFNEVLHELANREFTRITTAYDFLNHNLGQDDF